MERDVLMVIDIGNTQTSIGFWKEGTIRDAYRFQSDRDRTADEWGLWFRWVLQGDWGGPDRLRGVALASVVPPMTDRVVQACQKYLGQTPFVIEPGIRTGMPILYEDPKAVGADRIANAVAAFRELGGPCVVIDLGTATTFDIVSERGEYLGGVIAPGIEISADALFQRAARLPRVEVRRPPGVIGRNTPHAMQAGLFYGYAGLIERIAREIQAVLGERTQFIATGGLAPLLADTSPYMQRVDLLLTLRGIAYLYEMNQAES